MNKYDVPIKRKGQSKNRLVNENYFEKIDSKEKAYFLGLLFTDGGVSLDKERSPMIQLQLKSSDVDILQKLRTELNVHSSIRYDKRKNKETAILLFRNQKIANDLKQYGIIPNKTYETKHLPQVPNEFESDFLRGCLDGDGSIY